MYNFFDLYNKCLFILHSYRYVVLCSCSYHTTANEKVATSILLISSRTYLKIVHINGIIGSCRIREKKKNLITCNEQCMYE